MWSLSGDDAEIETISDFERAFFLTETRLKVADMLSNSGVSTRFIILSAPLDQTFCLLLLLVVH